MARARDHTQQHYNHGGHMNTKSSDGWTRHHIGHRQGTHQRLFLGTRFSYSVEITEVIPNLHTGINAHNQGMPAGETGSSKSKNPFTGPYCAYNQFYGHMTEDCHDI
ncbi:hypothetical protein Fot_21793 [Forsythia ovata]|uniref:Uncharacterized protein n=1 Tax=Forsythia ovata TaxID=205694 RepID=A0ABD1UW47_9LAMI